MGGVCGIRDRGLSIVVVGEGEGGVVEWHQGQGTENVGVVPVEPWGDERAERWA